MNNLDWNDQGCKQPFIHCVISLKIIYIPYDYKNPITQLPFAPSKFQMEPHYMIELGRLFSEMFNGFPRYSRISYIFVLDLTILCAIAGHPFSCLGFAQPAIPSALAELQPSARSKSDRRAPHGQCPWWKSSAAPVKDSATEARNETSRGSSRFYVWYSLFIKDIPRFGIIWVISLV